MCGIIGYIGTNKAIDVLFDGLVKLEYRGYDSAGIATITGNRIQVIKSKGKLATLARHLHELDADATIGIGHTRWATHGQATTTNAHPHIQENLAIVHNGIIENYNELKAELEYEGYKFETQTDTEVALKLIHQLSLKSEDTNATLFKAVERLRGAFAIGLMDARDPTRAYVVKQGSPLVIGIGEGENFFASDALALAEHTNKAIFLNDGEIAEITAQKVKVFNFNSEQIEKEPVELELASSTADKRGYRHFMQKEIHEQPRVLANLTSILTHQSEQEFHYKNLGLDCIDLARVKEITIVGCGTAHHAGLVAKYSLERHTKIRVSVELASEFRYRHPIIGPESLVIAISQSGETADTLASIKYAKQHDCQTLSICNVKFSSIPRECDANLYMECGPEIGVASTKAFTAMVFSLFIFGLAYSKRMFSSDDKSLKKQFNDFVRLPHLMEQAIQEFERIDNLCSKYYETNSCIFLGRGPCFPLALEGALKLKEISYIHAEGYSGGELKHGPIALIDRHMPVFCLCPEDGHFEKMLSNMEEVKAREGVIIGIGNRENSRLRNLCHDIIHCPEIENESLQTLISSVPLQLIAYSIGIHRGTDVDQPRNLAKSVTVE